MKEESSAMLDKVSRAIEGDYGLEIVAKLQDTNELIEQAKEFLQEAKRFLADG